MAPGCNDAVATPHLVWYRVNHWPACTRPVAKPTYRVAFQKLTDRRPAAPPQVGSDPPRRGKKKLALAHGRGRLSEKNTSKERDQIGISIFSNIMNPKTYS